MLHIFSATDNDMEADVSTSLPHHQKYVYAMHQCIAMHVHVSCPA